MCTGCGDGALLRSLSLDTLGSCSNNRIICKPSQALMHSLTFILYVFIKGKTQITVSDISLLCLIGDSVNPL